MVARPADAGGAPVSGDARTLPVTPAERACATVLRAYLAWQLSEDDVAPQVMVDLGASLRTEGLIAGYRAALTPAGRDLLARVESAERTPETVLRVKVDDDPPSPVAVLRAMAVSYAKAWIDESDDEDWEGYLYAVREALRECISSGSPGYMSQRIADDYEARRIGARGMNDPPLGAS